MWNVEASVNVWGNHGTSSYLRVRKMDLFWRGSGEGRWKSLPWRKRLQECFREMNLVKWSWRNIFQGKPQENKTWRRMIRDYSSWQRGVTGYKQETNILETRITRSAWIRNSLYNEENHRVLKWSLQNVSKGLYAMVLAITKAHRKIAVTEGGIRCFVQLSVLTGQHEKQQLNSFNLNILEGSFFLMTVRLV